MRFAPYGTYKNPINTYILNNPNNKENITIKLIKTFNEDKEFRLFLCLTNIIIKQIK